MDKRLLLLASYMLREATEVFNNHGCNDLNEEVMELLDNDILADIKVWNGGDDEWPTEACFVGDSSLMHYLSDKLGEAGKSSNENSGLHIADVSASFFQIADDLLLDYAQLEKKALEKENSEAARRWSDSASVIKEIITLVKNAR